MLSGLLRWVPNPIPDSLQKRTERNIFEEPDEEVTVRPLNHQGIGLKQHWGIVGMTGSGKSYFAQGLMEYLRVRNPHAKRYVLDSTEDGMELLRTGRREVRGNKVPDLLRDPAFTQIWVPDTDVFENYDAWFHKILYAREPCIVLIDELASLNKHGDAPDGFIKLLKQGRKHGATVIALSQSVARIDTALFGQMTHFAQFRLNQVAYDIQQVRLHLRITKEEQREVTAKYGFFYRRTDGNFPYREYPSMQAFFKSNPNHS